MFLSPMTIPRPEHPRPDFRRHAWLNLNGTWHFSFDAMAYGEQLRWHQTGTVSRSGATITVPFPWESRLSGQGRTDYKGAGWYEREVTIPAEWTGLDPVLHFGAVDWSARVWVNGRLVAENNNGFLPFEANLAGLAAPGETVSVTVRAYDIADAATLVGKQVPRWYTHSSGIWQTVWLEGRPAAHVQSVRFSPDIRNGQARAEIRVAASEGTELELALSSPQGLFEALSLPITGEGNVSSHDLMLDIPEARLWSPDDPFLHDVDVALTSVDGAADMVHTYFGMREIGRGKHGNNEYEYIYLNGDPIYLAGALDQAFHPDGLYTYPSDDVIRGDMELARAMGLNMLRCHIKINDPRYYYWADRLGVIIHYDMPSPDLDSPAMRRICEETVAGMMERDFNHPSIMLWVIFNETWGLSKLDTRDGQEWVRSLVNQARALDPTRLVEDNSPCNYDHVETDVNSWHFYINDWAAARAHVQNVVDRTHPGSDFNYIGEGNVQDTQPLMNSEYGGISAAMGDMDISWCFKYLTTDLRRHDKICGYVYTELTDIEWEHNGFAKYDRSGKVFGYDALVPDMSVADLNAPLFAGLDCPPCQTVRPRGNFAAWGFVSNWGPELAQAALEWEAVFTDSLGYTRTWASGTMPVAPRRFGVVSSPEPVSFSVPGTAGLLTVALRLCSPEGTVLHRNYVNVEVWAEAGGEEPGSLDERTRVTWDPLDYVQASWPITSRGDAGGKLAGNGPGSVSYRIRLPTTLSAVNGLEFLCELGSRASGMEKLSWPPRNWRSHSPQTMQDRQFPTTVDVYLQDVKVDTWELSDDPADARGVLSHHRGMEPGSHGYLQRVSVRGERLAALNFEPGTSDLDLRLDSTGTGSPRGFSVYGARAGAWPLGPTILID
ncbi:MAG: hypothetical protein OXG36_10940 [Caldilineaceae bacterium]|nr:hypothetical protein [Caldilineaceae bacterium]